MKTKRMLGISASLLLFAIFAAGFVSSGIAQNASEGSDIPLNASAAQSSPEAMNNTLTGGVGPENETVITP